MSNKLLIFIDWFLPAYKAGGPIQSVANLVKHLGDELEISIVTSNKDLGENIPLKNIIYNEWHVMDSCRVIYLDESHQNSLFYNKIFEEDNYSVVYFNSLFSLKFTLLPLWLLRKRKIKKVLAPRGMLGKGALSIKKIKKQIFLKSFKILKLHQIVKWHATAEEEEEEIKLNFGDKCNIEIVPNLSSKIDFNYKKKKKNKKELEVFFLSRISLKKNLINAIEMLSKVEGNNKIIFTIIGPINDNDYWETCKNKIDLLPNNIKVDYLGAIPNHELNNILKTKHVLLLPTQHENFGHVIIESWQNGCPVIISDQTPWQNLETKSIGFSLALNNHDPFVKAIDFFAVMDDNNFDKWSKKSFNFAKEFTENPELVAKSKKLFY